MSDLKVIAKELPNEKTDVIKEKLFLFKKELFNLRFQKTLGELTNLGRFSIVRKNIARLKTELTKRSKIGV